MAIKCILHDHEPDDAKPGDMWPSAPEYAPDDYLSNEYKRDWAGKRPPMWVQLPNNTPFLVDMALPDGHGWTVTGDPPNLTVHPSINRYASSAHPGWHGWLRNGELIPA